MTQRTREETMQLILEWLQRTGLTVSAEEIARHFDCHARTVNGYIRDMRALDMPIRKADYYKKGVKFVANWAYGDEPDAEIGESQLEFGGRVIDMRKFKLEPNWFDSWLFRARDEMRLAA